MTELFPLTKVTQLGVHLRIVKIELAREAATLIMLAAAGAIAASNFRSWLAAFALAFGAWDLSFYASLRVLIGWPPSLGTWDLLFLLPVPWVGPVLAPVIVAASLVAGGIVGLLREPARIQRIAWTLLIAGGIIIFVSFIWDWRSIVDGDVPRHFPWLIFSAGEVAGIAGFIFAMKTRTEKT